MKKIILTVAALMGLALTAKAQVKIGDNPTTLNASAALEIESASKGFLMPRVANHATITTPATGLQVYNTTTNTIWFYNGTAWVNSGASTADNLGNHSATQALVLNGFPLTLGAAGDNNHKVVVNATVGGPLITGYSGGALGTEHNGSTTVLTWKETGNVGIGTTAPLTTFHVAGDRAAYGGSAQAVITGATDPTQALILGYNTTADKGFIQSVHNGVTWTNLLLQPSAGNVGIGTLANGATSKLEVNGASTNYEAYNAGAGTAINFALSNLAYTTASAGAFTLQNIKNGGTYTLSVRGATAGTATFAATGFTVKYANNRATTVNTETLYTFIVMGTTVYVYTATGF